MEALRYPFFATGSRGTPYAGRQQGEGEERINPFFYCLPSLLVHYKYHLKRIGNLESVINILVNK